MTPSSVELLTESTRGHRGRARSRCQALGVSLALFSGTLLLFSRAMNHDFIDLDDPDYVTQNAHVQSGLTWSGVRWALTTDTAGNWHPLTWLSHMFDWQLFGENPHGPHTTNIVWHAFNTVLAFLVLRRLTGAFWTSAVSAAFFAWHPLRVESVAWIAERKDVLSAFFGLFALLMYARYAGGRAEFSAPKTRALRRVEYGLALFSFALGLLCKPMLVSLPFLLLLLDFWPLNRCRIDQPGRTLPGLIREKSPFLLLSLGSCIITYIAQTKGGAVHETMTLANRLAYASLALTGCLENFFLPIHLAIGYPRPLHPSMAAMAGSILLLSGITGLVLSQWQRRPWLIVGWLWFVGMLIPVIGLVPVGQQLMADRYTYLPALGLQLALLWTLREIVVSRRSYRLALIGAGALLIVSAARTWNQEAVWQNSRTLYEHALEVNPDSYLAHTYLGSTFLNENRLEDARSHFQKAVALRPEYRVSQLRLALALRRLDCDEAALAIYLNWLKFHPDDTEAEFCCANTLAGLNRDQEAVSHYERAIRLKPDFEPAHGNYADTLRALGRLEEACAQYQLAIQLQPRDTNAHYGLGAALQDSGRADEALGSYLRAIDLNPKFAAAHYDAGVLLLERNQPLDALRHFQAAVEIQTNYAAAYLGRGLAEEKLDRTQAAIGSLEQAQRLNPEASEVSEALLRLRGKLTAANTAGKP